MLTLLSFLVTLGVLIMVHEFGHFGVARACGVRVLRFSIGFGSPLVRWQRGADSTEWVVGAIPLGGYVRMLDERDPECADLAAKDPGHAFSRKPLWQRAAIVVAGPAANLLLAIVAYALLNLTGVTELRPVLGEPPAGSAAQLAGLREGDLVESIAGQRIEAWSEVHWRVVEFAQPGRALPIGVLTADGASRTFELAVDAGPADGSEGGQDLSDRLGLRLHPGPTIVHAVTPQSPAQMAGIVAGDRIEQVDGQDVRYAKEVAERVRAAPGRQVALTLVRDGQTRTVSVVPEAVSVTGGAPVGRIGVDFRDAIVVRHGPVESVSLAAAKTWDTAGFSLRMLGRMLVGQASWRNLSGPVTIADYAGQSVRIGWQAFVGFLALVSISLGVLNLLPVPLLDGGHLLYYAAELLTGSAPSERAVAIGQRIGAGVLTLLMALAMFNDVARLLS